MTRLKDFSDATKYEMKQDYLNGDSLGEIKAKYGLKDRSSVYYYIKPLTPEEKAQHTLNRARREEEQRGRKEVEIGG